MQEVRGTYPCLRVPTRDVKERELPDSQSMAKWCTSKGPYVHSSLLLLRQGLWKADKASCLAGSDGDRKVL